MDGDRENQLVRLQGGGFMLNGADNTGTVNGVAAATPQGLVDNHNIATLVSPDPATGLPGAYGPTIMTDHYDPVTRTDSVQMRVSQYGDLSMPKGPDGKWIYDPRTYTTTFTVSQPGGQ